MSTNESSAPELSRRKSSRTTAKPEPKAEPKEEKQNEKDKESEEEESEDEEKDEDKKSTDDLELEAEAQCLTRAERAELEKLLSEGFGTWTRRHLQLFIKANERYGRKDMDSIGEAVEGKTPAEVREYAKVFWKRYKELKDWDKMIKQIEKGEARLEKVQAIQRVIDTKVKKTKKPYETLKIPYPKTAPQKMYSEEEDRFLLCTLHKVGYGQWDDVKTEIRSSWQFRFDWFIKMRSSNELSKRSEYLVKQLMQAEEEAEEARKEKAKKEKAKEKAASKKKSEKGKDTKKKTESKKGASKKKDEKETKKKTTSKKKEEKEKGSKKKTTTSKKKSTPEKKVSKKKTTATKRKGEDESDDDAPLVKKAKNSSKK